MSDHSKIEWTDATWNPVTGCTMVSAGCTNCYAMRLAGTRLQHHPSRAGLTRQTEAGPIWTGEVRLNEGTLTAPIKWKRPRRIFVCAHGDLFHEKVDDWWRYLVTATMAMTYDVSATDENNVVSGRSQCHTYQVLTKRPDEMLRFYRELHAAAALPIGEFLKHPFAEASRRISRACGSPFWVNASFGALEWLRAGCPGLWLGVSVEDQATADERTSLLLKTPAAVHFVSYEPALGPVDLSALPSESGIGRYMDALAAPSPGADVPWSLDWVIAGGESGPHARPAHPDWFRSVRAGCVDAGVPFFFKQWGEWSPTRLPWEAAYEETAAPSGMPHWSEDGSAWAMLRVGKKRAGRELDGRTWDEMPGDPTR